MAGGGGSTRAQHTQHVLLQLEGTGVEKEKLKKTAPKVERVVEFFLEEASGGGGKEGGELNALVSEGEAVVCVLYAGKSYVLKLPPPAVMSAYDRVSSVADRLLADPNSEPFVKAVIQVTD